MEGLAGPARGLSGGTRAESPEDGGRAGARLLASLLFYLASDRPRIYIEIVPFQAELGPKKPLNRLVAGPRLDVRQRSAPQAHSKAMSRLLVVLERLEIKGQRILNSRKYFEVKVVQSAQSFDLT